MARKHVIGSVAIAATLALPLIKGFEGRSLKTYYDVVGVLTYCDGETQNAIPDKTYTDADCDAITKSKVNATADMVNNLITNPDLPPTRLAAMTSLTYNIGLSAFQHSTVLKKLNSNDVPGSCEAMKSWTYAHHIKWPGLVKRRQMEADLCMEGFNVGSH